MHILRTDKGVTALSAIVLAALALVLWLQFVPITVYLGLGGGLVLACGALWLVRPAAAPQGFWVFGLLVVLYLLATEVAMHRMIFPQPWLAHLFIPALAVGGFVVLQGLRRVPSAQLERLPAFFSWLFIPCAAVFLVHEFTHKLPMGGLAELWTLTIAAGLPFMWVYAVAKPQWWRWLIPTVAAFCAALAGHLLLLPIALVWWLFPILHPWGHVAKRSRQWHLYWVHMVIGAGAGLWVHHVHHMFTQPLYVHINLLTFIPAALMICAVLWLVSTYLEHYPPPRRHDVNLVAIAGLCSLLGWSLGAGMLATFPHPYYVVILPLLLALAGRIKYRPLPAPSGRKWPVTVSVITSNYNSGKTFLAEAIKSVQAQTFTDWEMIVSDDGSTDGSYKMAEEAAKTDPRIIVIRDKNGGSSAARNRAIAKACGRYIAMLDCDDIWYPEKLQIQLGAMAKTGASLCTAHYDIMQADGTVTGTYTCKNTWVKFERLLRTNIISGGNVIIDREAVPDITFKDEKLDEDFILWLDILQQIPVAMYVHQTLAAYRIHPASKSRSSSTKTSWWGRKIEDAKRRYMIYRKHARLDVISSVFNLGASVIGNLCRTLKKSSTRDKS